MSKYGNLSVRSARERLEAIYGAKDFLRSNQMEMPDMFGYYQRQIEDLSQEEDELNSWLKANGSEFDGEDYDDYDDEPYDCGAARDEISHFNDDLYGDSDDSCEPVIDKNRENPYNQNKSTDYEIGQKGDQGTGRTNTNFSGGFQTDPVSGKTYYVFPDGMLTPLSDPGFDNGGAESTRKESKKAPLLGQIYTDPDSGEFYHIAPDGNLTPMSGMENASEEEAAANPVRRDYNEIRAAPDYAEKSAAVTDGKNGSLYDYINDIGETRNKIYNDPGSENNWYGIYEYMSPEEVGTYNYLCATSGTEEGEKYLRSLGNTPNGRLGAQIAESARDSTGAQVMYGFLTGLDRSLGGISRAIPGNEDYKSPHEYARELVRSNLRDAGGDVFGNSYAQVAFDVLDNAGYALPGIVTSCITGGLLSGAGAGAKAAGLAGALAGNAGIAALTAKDVYRGLKEDGYSDVQAGLYAAASAAVNGTMQAMLGGVPGLSIEKGVVSGAIKGISGGILQAGARIGINALSQGAVQAMQSAVSDLLECAILGGESGVDWEKAGYQAVLGAILGGGMTGVKEAVKAAGGAPDRAGNEPAAAWQPEKNSSVGAKEIALEDRSGITKELAKTSPVIIPSNAIIKSCTKAGGYDQISYKWTDSEYKYEARWHTKTPGAPTGQGNTWVITRVTPGTATGKARKVHILAGDKWVSRFEWQAAINAYKSGTMTTAQEAMLKAGHWLVP